MEDPWLNAWRDDQNSSPPQTWSSSNNVTDDQVDIAVPSWAPESPILWSSDKSPDPDILPPPAGQEPALIQEDAYTLNDVDAVCDQESSKKSLADADGPPTEDALEAHAPDPWILPQVEGADWVATDDVAKNQDPESLDEWELAKRQKELQDRYVPPKLLASILSRFDEFAADYWPQEPSERITHDYKYDDLADALGVPSIVDRLVPADLTLPPAINFMKSFISKEMIDALKLTRHHPATLYSPLAMYMNSKGSLSWEASVKSQPYVPEMDVAPSGWRIVSQENPGPQQSTTDKKKKAPGGLLSFFSRKTTFTTSSDSPSPTRVTTPATISPRTSTTSHASSDAEHSTAVVPKTLTDTTRSATMSALAEISTTSNIDASTLSSEAVSVQTSSAISRFLGRFSRSNRSSASNSLALSTDDLEFLSDIVPSLHDGTDDIDQLNALSSAIHAPPIPEKLPPPLVPPPRASPVRLTSTPSVNSRPSNQTSANSHPDSVKGFIESPLSPGFSQQQSRFLPQKTPSSFRVIPPMQVSGSPGLQLPLSLSSASCSSTNKLSRVSAPTKSYLSLPVDDRFSDSRMSSNNTPLISSISSSFNFGSFTNSTEPIESLQIHDQSVSFDDFDDFVSSPPRVPEKESPVPLPRLIPPPPRPAPLTGSVPTIRQARSPIEPRQAGSDQRASNLLETAATREVRPAPPPPLPDLIPPSTTGNDLFYAYDGPSRFSPSNITGPHIVSSLSSLSESNTSPTILAAPPPPETVTTKSTASTIASGNGLRQNGMTNLSHSIPPPNSPPPPLTRSQNQHDQKMQLQLQWRNPVSIEPPSSSTQPTSSSTSLAIGQGGSLTLNGRSSETLLQQHPQQHKSETDAFSLLFSPAIAPTPSYLHSENKNSSSNSQKLSAQDLSFFEGL